MFGLTGVTRKLRKMAERADNLDPVWPRVGDDVADAMLNQFKTKGALGGRPWAPLKPEYRAWKVKHGLSPEILIATGDMRDSLTDRPMQVERYEGRSAVFGTRDPKYKFHHYGTRFMPQRRVVKMVPGLEKQIADRLRAYVFDGEIKP